jgi:hypothetical protein
VPEAAPALETKKATPPKRTPRSRYRYVADERLEEIVSESKKKSSRRGRRRQLVLDEESGQLISRRRHRRRGDDEVEWEDEDF